jgi:hypothetical protein
MDFHCLDSYSNLFQASVRSCSRETIRAKESAASANIGSPTIFSKIIDRSIPAEILYEDDLVGPSFMPKQQGSHSPFLS